MKKLLFAFPLFVLLSCGEYPEVKGKDSHNAHEESAQAPGGAELTGEGYVPKFLAAGYKTQNIEYEIKETIVDLGGGFKYRALTYDGSFPAKSIVVEQGTLVRIKVVNRDSAPHGIHTHVIKYTPANDGVGVSETGGGQTRYYFWEVSESTPPGFYPFHDHGGDSEGAQMRGLVGLVNVVKAGESANPGYGILLHDIDPLFVFSTNGEDNGRTRGGHAGGHGGATSDSVRVPAHLVNGKFGAQTENTFHINKGQELRLGIVNLGSQAHTFHSHGNSWSESDGRLNDNLDLLPGSFRTVQLKAEAEGTWLYHCHLAGHPEGGMWGNYIVH